MNNSMHLKRYVETHPDNKMAWYLLGKEYERAGEQGKATYCYNRAEEVYEAFELSKVPADIWKNYEQRLLQHEREKELRRRRNRRWLVALALLLIVLIPPAQAPGYPGGLPAEAEAQADAPASAAAIRQAVGERSDKPMFTAVAGGREGAAGDGAGKETDSALTRLLKHPERLPSWSVALGMPRQGKWLLWSSDMERLYGLHRDRTGEIAITPFEGAAGECLCEPQSSAGLARSAGQWADLQLETAVLEKAVEGYQTRHGRLPDSLDELTRPFPNNWLSGRSRAMEDMFDVLIQRKQHDAPPGKVEDDAKGNAEEGEAEDKSGYWGTSPDGAPYFKEPLQVIIDKDKHRLAVVSGKIMLRNYAVGLGGAKTPLGDFQISDKVVNPNGTTKGPYGTRGMQLSDTQYAIHGTEDLDSIGADESEGCIRMLREDVEELFDLVPMGTSVKIREGVLPDGLWTPKERFKLKHSQGQTNPAKVYHWLD